MSRIYKLTIVGCALSWFLVGLSLATVLQAAGISKGVGKLDLGLLAGFVVLGIADLRALLRGDSWRATPASTDVPAT